jgi:methionyl-tRNA formyltransferase
MSQPLNFVFFGTPDVASKTLDILKSHGYIPSLIVTGPDRPVGRHFVMTPSPVKVWAEENGVPFVHIPPTEGDYDLFIVVAYGKILSQEIIDMPKLGTLNIHYSLLPKYRGASPVESALLHGDTETGVSIQKMVFKLDAGPVIAEERTPIYPNETHTELRNRLIPTGAELLARLLSEVSSSYQEEVAGGRRSLEGVPQNETLATHCGKIKKENGLVNPLADNPQELWNKYRAYYGWPGIYFLDKDNKRVKITTARYDSNTFIIERVTPEGKKDVDWETYKKTTC